MIINSINGQSLNGKWLLKDIDPGNSIRKGYPGFQLLEIKNKNAEMFTNFSLTEKWEELKLVDDKILTDKNKKFAKYKLVNENHLKLFMDGESNNKDVVFECDFFRLIPTITALQKTEIEKLSFLLKQENGTESELIFNKELMDKETLKLFKKKEGYKMLIDQIDATLFVSIYDSGKRRSSFPIKEVTSEFIKLYAIPTGPMEMIAYRKE